MADALRKPSNLYDRDFYAWTVDQAAKLRARAAFDNRGDIDWENAAEEIESVGGRDRRELQSRMVLLLHHLLKWRWQPERQGTSWRRTIREQRRQIRALLEQSPSLSTAVRDGLPTVYQYAVADASDETGLAASVFPAECPFTIEQILDADFYPNA